MPLQLNATSLFANAAALPVALKRLPNFFAAELTNEIRRRILPLLRQLVPKHTGRLAKSFDVSVRIQSSGSAPRLRINYIYYGRWIHFRRPIEVPGSPRGRARTVPELVRRVLRKVGPEVYNRALSNFAKKYRAAITAALGAEILDSVLNVLGSLVQSATQILQTSFPTTHPSWIGPVFEQ